MFKHNCGGAIGNLVFVWKVPKGPLDQQKQYECISSVRDKLPQFERRASADLFRKKFSKIAGITPVLRRSLVEFLTGKIPE